MQKRLERHFGGEALEVVEQGPPLSEPCHRSEVVEHDLAADAVELDMTAARKEGEALLDLLAD